MSSLLWVTSENLSKLEEKQRKSKKYLSSEEVQFLNAFVQERIKGTIGNDDLMFRVQSLLETEKMALSANANYLNSIKFPKRTLILDRGPFIKNPIEIKVWGEGKITFPENAQNLELSELFKDTGYSKWQFEDKHWTPKDIFNQTLGKGICIGDYLRGGNGEVILGVSSNAGVELCNRRGLKPAELKDWMVFWTLVYGRTGKKFNEKSFWDIDNYLLRDDDNKRDKLIERIIKDLEQVEEDFGVEFFDRDNKGNITRIYYNRLNYSSLNDTAVCGCIDSNHQSAPSNFGSGLGFLPYSRNHCHKADACRSSGPISE